jgi:hypothetical protein
VAWRGKRALLFFFVIFSFFLFSTFFSLFSFFSLLSHLVESRDHKSTNVMTKNYCDRLSRNKVMLITL